MLQNDFMNKSDNFALLEGEKNFEKGKDKSSTHGFCNAHKLHDFY